MHDFSPGERFGLHNEVFGIEMREGRTCAVLIPAKTIVEIRAFPCAEDDRMAAVTWGDRIVMMFGMDLMVRAEKVKAV